MLMNDTTFLQVIGICITVFATAVGWGVKIILSNLRQIREDIKGAVHKDTCAAHREFIETEIADLKAIVKFGRRGGDSLLMEVVKTFNQHVEGQSGELNGADEEQKKPIGDSVCDSCDTEGCVKNAK